MCKAVVSHDIPEEYDDLRSTVKKVLTGKVHPTGILSYTTPLLEAPVYEQESVFMYSGLNSSEYERLKNCVSQLVEMHGTKSGVKFLFCKIDSNDPTGIITHP